METAEENGNEPKTEFEYGEQDDNGEEYEDDEDEDEIEVTIDTIKPMTTFDLSKAAERASAQKAAQAQPGGQTGNNASGQQANKIDLDAPAFIGNVPAYEYNIDSVADEDKPWRKPGADITDYFNYGFTEDTWKVYCDRQRTLRALFGEGQSGAKMLAAGRMMPGPMPRSIPSVLPNASVEQEMERAGDEPKREPQPQMPPMMFNQPPPVRGAAQGISVIGTIGGGNKPDQRPGAPEIRPPFGMPPFGFPPGQPPNPMLLAQMAQMRPGMMPPGANNPDLIRLLQSNPALASQVLQLGGARPQMRPNFPTLGNPGAMADDKPGRTPSPRGGSTPSSSPEREDANNNSSSSRRRSRSPRGRRDDDQGARRIGVLGGGSNRRDFGDRRGDWDRGGSRRDRDRDRGDRSSDRR